MPIRNIWQIKIGSWILEAFDIKMPKVVIDTHDRAGNPVGLDKAVDIVAGKKRVEFGFSVYAKRLGAEGSLPVVRDLLLAAGFAENAQDTDGDGTNDTFEYAPKALTAGLSYVDVEMQADTGYYISIDDAVVKSVKITAKTGEPVIVTFDLVGKLNTENITGSVSGNFDNKEPFVAKSIVLGADVPDYFDTFELSIDNDVAERSDPTDPAGVYGFIITGQTITASIDPEFVIKHPTDALATFSLLIGDANDYLKIEGANVKVKDMEPANADGIIRANITLGFYPSTVGANDALKLTFAKVE